MVVVRDVFQARYGHEGQLVELFKEARQKWPQGYGTRILTDLSGPFFTVVVETEIESLAEWEKRRDSIFARPDFGQWFARMMPLVESGRREFYSLR